MKREENGFYKFESISDAHNIFGLPKPVHPLISLLSITDSTIAPGTLSGPHVLSFYKISYRPRLSPKLKYGQSYYDFEEGGLLFASPNQLIGADDGDPVVSNCSQFVLLIHPDFFLGYPLAKKIKQYGFFSYATDEALHLSENEKEIILTIFNMIRNELNSRIDDFSQDVVISHIDVLLTYATRFYKRQFITRKTINKDILQKLEDLVDEYLNTERGINEGLLSVQYLADHLNVSASYLSDLLRSLIGLNTQQYVHNKLIDKAKEKLSTTSLSVSEVAFALGFEHSQSFSKLFKTKTKLSPLEFRKSFN